jgi:hypothetical protein
MKCTFDPWARVLSWSDDLVVAAAILLGPGSHLEYIKKVWLDT